MKRAQRGFSQNTSMFETTHGTTIRSAGPSPTASSPMFSPSAVLA